MDLQYAQEYQTSLGFIFEKANLGEELALHFCLFDKLRSCIDRHILLSEIYSCLSVGNSTNILQLIIKKDIKLPSLGCLHPLKTSCTLCTMFTFCAIVPLLSATCFQYHSVVYVVWSIRSLKYQSSGCPFQFDQHETMVLC